MIETKRLILRELTKADYLSLCEILQDPEVMYAYEGAFSEEEVQIWLSNQINRQKDKGLGLNAVLLKETGQMI